MSYRRYESNDGGRARGDRNDSYHSTSFVREELARTFLYHE